MELFDETEIAPVQAEAIARGLWAVARADGTVHEREAVLVAQFYRETVQGSPTGLAALQREPPIAPDALAAALGYATRAARLFLDSAVLLAMVDSDFSDAERRVVTAFADALQLGVDEVARSTERVRDHLMSQLAHISNTDAVLAVSRELPR